MESIGWTFGPVRCPVSLERASGIGRRPLTMRTPVPNEQPAIGSRTTDHLEWIDERLPASRLTLPSALHQQYGNHAAAAISRLIRCTVPLPTPTILATLRMP